MVAYTHHPGVGEEGTEGSPEDYWLISLTE